MASGRLLASLALLALLVGAATALALWPREAGMSGEYPVRVEGPAGVLLEERVAVENATALAALTAAAARAGVPLEVEHYPGMGAYVRAIGGHRAEGPSGWVYEVRREGGAWTAGDRSAELYDLQAGDEVRWRWVTM